MVGVIQRERPVAVGILAASLAFRLFALMIPLTYVLVAGLGFAAQASAERGQPQLRGPPRRPGGRLGGRRHPHLGPGPLAGPDPRRGGHAGGRRRGAGGAALGAPAGLADAAGAAADQPLAGPRADRRLRGRVRQLDPGRAGPGRRQGPGQRADGDPDLGRGAGGGAGRAVAGPVAGHAPPPRACPGPPWCRGRACSRSGSRAFSLAVSLYFAPRAARASTVYGSLGVALVLLVSLFLFARLAVAAAELNATLWERRRTAGGTAAGHPRG